MQCRIYPPIWVNLGDLQGISSHTDLIFVAIAGRQNHASLCKIMSSPFRVSILSTLKSHDRLGEIVVDTATHSATLGKDVEQKLRQEAAKLGADAVVVVYDRRQPMGAYVMGGYWDQSIETVTERNVVGVAIKYWS